MSKERTLPGKPNPRGEVGATASSSKKKDGLAVTSKEYRAKQKGVLVWLLARIDGPDREPVTVNEPYPKQGVQGEGFYPRILYEGKPLRIKGQRYIDDRGILIYLWMNDGRAQIDKQECIDKKFLTEEDFERMAEGVHPDEHKDGPNEVAPIKAHDVNMMDAKLADEHMNKHGISAPQVASLEQKRMAIRAALKIKGLGPDG